MRGWEGGIQTSQKNYITSQLVVVHNFSVFKTKQKKNYITVTAHSSACEKF